MFFDLVLGLKNLFLKIKYRDTYCDIILSMIVSKIGVTPPPDHETPDLISKQGYNALQKALLMRLQEIAPNLTTYRAGPVAAAQIISNGKYVLEDARQIKKFQTDLNNCIKGPVPEQTRITSRDDISADTVEKLREYLKHKGYEQINIQANLGKERSDSAATRETVSSLSKSSL